MANTLLIVGAGPGMSFSTALRFGREGWHIVLASRNLENTAALVTRLQQKNIEASALAINGADLSAVRQAVQDAISSEHVLSALLYNIGNTQPKGLLELTDKEITDNLLADVGGAITATKAAAEAFGGKGGSILLTGGGLALYPSPDYPILSLAKAALRNFAQGLFPFLQAKNIHIAILTIACMVEPESKEAADIAEHYWQLVAQPIGTAAWEAVYP